MNCVLHVRERIGTPYPMKKDALFYQTLDLICVDIPFHVENWENVFRTADLLVDIMNNYSRFLEYTISINNT